MPPKSKKRKTKDTVTDDEYLELLDRGIWNGWCEIESEPAYFNVMLRELGVQGAKVEEVCSLDEAQVSLLPKPIYALIFLFQYRGNSNEQAEDCCPDHVWFANQVPDFSCASVALLNIVNNIPGISLGPHLQSFKDFTNEMSPMSRGYSIDSFDFLKQTHNSFARELEILSANMHLKQKHDKSLAKSRAEDRRKAREAKAADKASQLDSKDQREGTRKSARQPKPRTDLTGDANVLQDDAESGYHFIAFMPIKGHLWKLDGMDSFPMDLGSYEALGDWMHLAAPAVQQRMEEYVEGELSFSLMAVVRDPYEEASKALERHDQILKNGPANRVEALDPSPEDVDRTQRRSSSDDDNAPGEIRPSRTDSKVGSKSPKNDMDVGNTETETPPLSEAEVVDQRQKFYDEMESRAKDDCKAELRRHDYRPFFTAWLDALEEADALEGFKETVKAGL